MDRNTRIAKELVRLARSLVATGKTVSPIEWKMTSMEEGPNYFGPKKGENGYDEDEVGFYATFSGAYGEYVIEAFCTCSVFSYGDGETKAYVYEVKISKGGTTVFVKDLSCGDSYIDLIDEKPRISRKEAMRKIKDSLDDALAEYKNRIDSGEFASASDIDIMQVLKDLRIYDCKTQEIVKKRDTVWKSGKPVYLRDCKNALDELSSFLVRNGYSSPSDCKVKVDRNVEDYGNYDYESEMYGRISDVVVISMNGSSWRW